MLTSISRRHLYLCNQMASEFDVVGIIERQIQMKSIGTSDLETWFKPEICEDHDSRVEA